MSPSANQRPPMEPMVIHLCTTRRITSYTLEYVLNSNSIYLVYEGYSRAHKIKVPNVQVLNYMFKSWSISSQMKMSKITCQGRAYHRGSPFLWLHRATIGVEEKFLTTAQITFMIQGMTIPSKASKHIMIWLSSSKSFCPYWKSASIKHAERKHPGVLDIRKF